MYQPEFHDSAVGRIQLVLQFLVGTLQIQKRNCHLFFAPIAAVNAA